MKLLDIKQAKLNLMKKLNENNEDEVRSLKRQLEAKRSRASTLRDSITNTQNTSRLFDGDESMILDTLEQETPRGRFNIDTNSYKKTVTYNTIQPTPKDNILMKGLRQSDNAYSSSKYSDTMRDSISFRDYGNMRESVSSLNKMLE